MLNHLYGKQRWASNVFIQCLVEVAVLAFLLTLSIGILGNLH